MLSIRVFFKKLGPLAYISHLDLNRAVLRAFQRAKLPVVYTEGFNPHPKLVFTQPLSLFQESETEIFEFKVEPDIPYDEIEKRLRGALPVALEITKVGAPVKKLSEIAFAEYVINIKSDGISADEVERLLSQKIIVIKKTKKGEEEVDISPQIKVFSVEETGEGISISATLSNSSDSYLNPQYIVDYLNRFIKIESSGITRYKLFDRDMSLFE